MDLPTVVVREAWLWLGGSLVLAMFWTNLAWLFSPWVEARSSRESTTSLAERIVFRLANWRFAPSLFQGLRLLYYVGLPSVALFWGHDAVVGRLLGLQRLALPTHVGATSGNAALHANWSNWLHDLGWATGLGLGSLGLLLLAAYTQQQALDHVSTGARRRKPSAWKTARDAIYREVHWAFYRNAPIVALGPYWGTWTGLTLVALEALVNPLWRNGLRDPDRAWVQLSRGVLVVVSSLLYLQTQNLWLALLLNWGISWTLGAVYVTPSAAPSQTVSSRDQTIF